MHNGEDITFSPRDLRQFDAQGLTMEKVRSQLAAFRRGPLPVRLNRPCSAGDGITVIPEEEHGSYVRRYERAQEEATVVKFVPASGAATRMFRDWYTYLDRGDFPSAEARASFCRDLPGYAFAQELRDAVARRGGDAAKMLAQETCKLIAFILTPDGLNYGQLPKALLPFHGYPEGNRTALEEHLVEAALYARGAGDVCRVHFTVSQEHRHMVERHLQRAVNRFAPACGVRFDFGISVQESSTNTIAVDTANRPVRDQDGGLVFRPGGHGALLMNLNGIDADVIFIKNIDNVVTDRRKPVTVRYKQVLAGYLLCLQDEIFRYDRALAGAPEESLLADVANFCRYRLSIGLPYGFEKMGRNERMQCLAGLLERPLRVCGMVRNEGEPGGGPFWVEGPQGTQSVQIVEEIQVDRRDELQRACWQGAAYFNPVDLVCAVRDRQGSKFDLNRFVDVQAFSITEKSEKGRDVRALELPGLWNGSMAYWNTAFVAVPLETFNPVKTVADLLRPAHRQDD